MFANIVAWVKAHQLRVAAAVILVVVSAGAFINIPVGPTTEINIGGAIVPLLLSGAAIVICRDEIVSILIATVFGVWLSRVCGGVAAGGTEMVTWAFAGYQGLFVAAFAKARPALVGYASATIGVLIGLDLLNLHELQSGAVVSIGGAGLADGILLVGPLTALAASAAAYWFREEA